MFWETVEPMNDIRSLMVSPRKMSERMATTAISAALLAVLGADALVVAATADAARALDEREGRER